MLRCFYFISLVGAVSAATLVSTEAKFTLVQQNLRGDGTPISTPPRVTPGSGPPPEPYYSRKPGPPPSLWPDKSHYPFIVQTFLACCWICVIGSLPFLIPVIDHQPVTKTQKIVGASMLTVLFGGVYLFTNIILFNSVHFSGSRPLTVVECIYFMSQVLTTVGYGDIVPAKVRGQIFVGLYVLGALFIIAMLVSDVTNHVALAAHKYRESLMGSMANDLIGKHKCKHEVDPAASARRRASSVHDLIAPSRPSAKPLMASLASFLVIDLLWILFFSFFPGEEKTVFQALYMSVITLSTVGLGAFTPLTEEGMIFGAFFMLFGSAALVSSVTNFCTLVVKMNEYERFNSDSKKKAANHLKEVVGDTNKVTQMQFFEWAVLSQKLMTESQIRGILQSFQNCNPTDDKIPLAIIEESMEQDFTPR
jgi:hypothetical protein